MAQKVFRGFTTLILILLPYSNILSGIAPYLSGHRLADYILGSVGFAGFSVILLLIIYKKKKIAAFNTAGWLLSLLGSIVAPPLMMGPPDWSPTLIQHTAEEHFRFGMLGVATIFFATGFFLILRQEWKELSAFNKLIIIPFISSVIIMLWDNFTSYRLSSELAYWLSTGKTADMFFSQYDFHELLRTLGRSLVYIIIAWQSIILLQKKLLRNWVALVLPAFGFAGLIFFFLFNFLNQQFYFPFMIPAIALAPAYWLGLALLSTVEPVKS
ncbi:hypothetical protein [Niabella aquatica]